MQSLNRVLFVGCAAAVALAACGSDDDTTAPTDAARATAASPTTSMPPEVTSSPSTAPSTSTDAPATSPSATTSSTTSAPAEKVALTVGVPFGVVPISALGSLDADPELVDVANVTEQSIATPDQLRTGFIAGDLDVAVVPTNIGAALSNRDVDVRLLSIIDAQLLRVLGPAGATWTDLAGATIDIPFQGDIADIVFRDLAAANGVDLDTVDIRYGTALPDLIGAAATGNVSFAVLPEHFASAAATQAGANGHDLVPIIDLQAAWSDDTGGDRLPQIALIATGALVDARPDVVAALRNAVERAIRHTAEDPEGAAATLAAETGLPQPLLATVVPGLDMETRSTDDAAADLDVFFADINSSNPETLGGGLPSPGFYAP
ncbi:MAG: ABC transporter substrate-binding protein [Actinomycetota bacterium]